ncbi:Pyruvate dehydrogenase E1 component subunit beta-2 [Nymphaea thermarum]|nr:Pyruvate dehydrogenase E1 component subunit beta-2 [Nymphaea thermarum]
MKRDRKKQACGLPRQRCRRGVDAEVLYENEKLHAKSFCKRKTSLLHRQGQKRKLGPNGQKFRGKATRADKSVNTCFKENSKDFLEGVFTNLQSARKNSEDFLEGVFTNLQSARKESRTSDVALLKEQVQLMLREWKAYLKFITGGKFEVVLQNPYLKFIAGDMVSYALQSADILSKEGISAEVINLLSIRPLDRETIFASVKKTNRLLLLKKVSHSVVSLQKLGFQSVMEECFDYLEHQCSELAGPMYPCHMQLI